MMSGARRWLDDLSADLCYGIRQWRRAPGFAAIAMLVLALGVGATTTVFSVVDAVLLRPLPFPESERMVSVFEAMPSAGIMTNGASYADFEQLRDHNHVFAAIAGIQAHDLTLTGRGEPIAVRTVVATSGMFQVAGVAPLLGRALARADDEKGSAPVVVLSERLWRERFGSDRAIVGRSIDLDKKSFTVVGVMPAAFAFPLQMRPAAQIWIPLVQDPLFSGWIPRPGGHWLPMVARLAPGVSLEQARAEASTIGARLAQTSPDRAGWIVRVEPMQSAIVGDATPVLVAVLAASALVLLIACVNIASLLLARTASRTGEIGLRMALGAGRARIVRQLLAESVLLGAAGAAGGVLLAAWAVDALRVLVAPHVPPVGAIRIDGPVLAFALGLSAVSSIVFGLAPALAASRPMPAGPWGLAPKSAGHSRERRRLHDVLATAEIAIAMAVLVAAGLFVRSFAALAQTSPGFDPQHVVKASVQLPQFQYATPQSWNAFADRLLERVQSEPGLQDAAIAVPLPIADPGVNLAFDIAGAPPAPPEANRTADYVAATPGYFRVMGIPLVRGRGIERADDDRAPQVVVISEALARRYFPDRDAIGQTLVFAFPPHAAARWRIVGVAGDVRDASLGRAPAPMMYVPFAQAPFWGGQLVVRTDLPLARVLGAIRARVHEIDPDLPITDEAFMADALGASVSQPRFRMIVFGSFGVLALVLAAAGVFGVISYSVSRRSREVGVRIALGASSSDIVRLVLTESAWLVGLGLAAGIPAALVAGRVLAHLLFGVGPADPITFAGVAVLLALSAAAASLVPAWRAMRVDPAVALRQD